MIKQPDVGTGVALFPAHKKESALCIYHEWTKQCVGMKKIGRFLGLLSLLFSFGSAFAGSETEITTQTQSQEKVPLDIFETENAYVFESDLNHGGSFGKQYELQNAFEYGHRFQITGNFYLHGGLAYKRFDFGNTDAPVPVHLQSFAGVIGIDYMHGADVGALLQFRPGFYTEENIGLNSFDCPIILARFFVLQPDKLYVMIGAYVSFLRGNPVVPLPGVVWIPYPKVRVMGVLPEPRVIYSATDKLDFYAGAEIEGGAFRTDHDKDLVGPHIAKLSGTQVDYADYRAGAGFTFDLTNAISIDGGGGYAIQRSFNFHRAGEYYRTDPAPYLKIELKAKF
jgi:hypothetical protein